VFAAEGNGLLQQNLPLADSCTAAKAGDHSITSSAMASRRSRWTRLPCRRFAANAVRLQLHALAYNLANFLRTLALPGRGDDTAQPVPADPQCHRHTATAGASAMLMCSLRNDMQSN